MRRVDISSRCVLVDSGIVDAGLFPVHRILRMMLNKIVIPKYADNKSWGKYGAVSGGFIFTLGDFHASVFKHALDENPGPQPCLHPWCALLQQTILLG